MTKTRFTVGGRVLEAPTDAVLGISQRLLNIAAIEDRRDPRVKDQEAKVKVKLMKRDYSFTTNQMRKVADDMRRAATNVKAMNRHVDGASMRPLFDGGWITKFDVETVIQNSRPYARSIPTQVRANRQNATRLWNWLRRFLVAKKLIKEYCTVCGDELDRLLVCRCGSHESKGWTGTEGVRVVEFVALVSDKSFQWPYRPGNIKDNLEELVEAASNHVPPS